MPAPTDSLLPRCNLCAVHRNDMNRCSGCKGVQYCSREHQAADWPVHKSQCSPLKRALRKLAHEHSKLGDDFFIENEGYFWGMIETRDYMRARFDVAFKLQHLVSNAACKAALGHFREMLKLCRSDNLGVRDIMPGLYLRLGRDQECYDFVKWYATEGERGDYDWGDMSLPFLNLKGEDVSEDLGYFRNRFALAHNIGILLLKLRMLLDFQDLMASYELTKIQNLHGDAVRMIQDQLPHRSGIWKHRPELLRPKSLEERIEKLQGHCDLWFDRINKGNKFFWKGLMENETYLYAEQEPYSMGSPQEMSILVQYCARSWIETDGALEWAKKKMQ